MRAWLCDWLAKELLLGIYLFYLSITCIIYLLRWKYYTHYKHNQDWTIALNSFDYFPLYVFAETGLIWNTQSLRSIVNHWSAHSKAGSESRENESRSKMFIPGCRIRLLDTWKTHQKGKKCQFSRWNLQIFGQLKCWYHSQSLTDIEKICIGERDFTI